MSETNDNKDSQKFCKFYSFSDLDASKEGSASSGDSNYTIPDPLEKHLRTNFTSVHERIDALLAEFEVLNSTIEFNQTYNYYLASLLIEHGLETKESLEKKFIQFSKTFELDKLSHLEPMDNSISEELLSLDEFENNIENLLLNLNKNKNDQKKNQ